MYGTVKILLLVSVIGLAACGGSGGSSGGDPSDEEIQNDAPNNAAPSVDAGNDITVELVDRVILTGTVSDDGLPSNVLNLTWSRTAGPASATISASNSLESEVVFKEIGVYRFSLLADDGEASDRDEVEITVVETPVLPSENTGGNAETDSPSDEPDDASADPENPASNGDSDESGEPTYASKEHSSGLRLEYIDDEVLADSTDIDWMYRMWGGVAQCQRTGATTAYPTIRLATIIATPEPGDLLSEDGGGLYRFNLEKQFIEVLNSGTSANAGTNQGLVLAEAMSWYMGFQVNDNWQGSDCAAWHSGGRHHPSPGRAGIGDVSYVHDLSIPIQGQFLTVKSDTSDVDEFTLGNVGKLWEAVAQCHGYSQSKPALINEILVVSGKSDLFAGDKWDKTGSYTVNDGGQIVIDSTDLLNVRTNPDWGKGLHRWINAFLDAYADNFYPNYECRDLNNTSSESVLPIQLE